MSDRVAPPSEPGAVAKDADEFGERRTRAGYPAKSAGQCFGLIKSPNVQAKFICVSSYPATKTIKRSQSVTPPKIKLRHNRKVAKRDSLVLLDRQFNAGNLAIRELPWSKPAWLYADFLIHPLRLRIGLKSHMRLSGSDTKMILDHVTRRPNALSAELKGSVGGLNLAETPLSAISRFNWSPSRPKRGGRSKRLARMIPRSARIWSSQRRKLERRL